MKQEINQLAKALNDDITAVKNVAFDVLSKKGKRMFFPSKGILGQSAEAKDSKINATIGQAFEEDGSPLALECIEQLVNIPSESFLYSPSYGLPALRTKWKELLYVKNPSLQGKQVSLPVVTSALTHALSVTAYLFVDERDKIILSDFNWDNYELIFEYGFGGRLQTYPTFKKNKYNVDGLFQKLMASGEKKILLLNFPNNPAGYTLTDDEAVAVKDCILKAAEAGKKVVVILDDAYFGLVYEQGVYNESMFSLLADLHENVMVAKLDGPTKEDYVWGFRIGFITFGIKGATPEQYRAMEAKAGGIVRGGISNCSSLSQHLLLKGFSNAEYAAQKEQKYSILKSRYNKIREIFAAHPEYKKSFQASPFNSGYFMCVKPMGVDAEAVRKELLATHGTGVIVLSGLIRIAFSAVACDKLEQLFVNLDAAIRKVRG